MPAADTIDINFANLIEEIFVEFGLYFFSFFSEESSIILMVSSCSHARHQNQGTIIKSVYNRIVIPALIVICFPVRVYSLVRIRPVVNIMQQVAVIMNRRKETFGLKSRTRTDQPFGRFKCCQCLCL